MSRDRSIDDPDVPDTALVAQSLAGDKDAYGLLVRRYQNCAYAAALESVRVPVREAAARALCAIGDVRAPRPLLRMLYAIGTWHVHAIFEDGSILGIPGTREGLLEAARGGGPGRNTALYALAHAKGDAEVYETALAIFRDPAAEHAKLLFLVP